VLNNPFAPLELDTLAGDANAKPNWVAEMPAPESAKAMLTAELINRCAPRGFTPGDRWAYRHPDGRYFGVVVRYDGVEPGGKKVMLPFTYCRNAAGRAEWRCQQMPEPRPIFGLDLIARNPKATVLVAEGEKAVCAARRLFPEVVTTTSPAGSKAADRADWSPLRGRWVVIWPDADGPGHEYAAAVARLPTDAGAASVSIVKLPDGLPVGWDLADPLPDGIDVADLHHLLFTAAPAMEQPAGATWACPDFSLLAEGRRGRRPSSTPSAERHAALVARKLRRDRSLRFNARELRREIGGLVREADAMASACSILVEAGLIRGEPSATGRDRGRRPLNYEVNPMLLKEVR
jgi:hypothetical protein